MSTVLIHESRRLVFPLDTVVDAVIDLERQHERWPVQARLVSVKLSRRSGLTLTVATSSKASGEERRYPLATLAAAVIHYCARMHVPMPRNATKSVKIIAEGFELALETKLFLQRQHAEPPADASTNTVNLPQLTEEAADVAAGDTQAEEMASLTAATTATAATEDAAAVTVAGATAAADAAVPEPAAPEAGDEQAA